MTGVRVPPHSPIDEGMVIGSMLIDKEACEKAMEALKPTAFYEPRHARVFEAILELYKQGVAVDVASVASELRDKNALAAIGGAEFLTNMIVGVSTSAHVGYHCGEVRKYFTLRELSRCCTSIIKDCFEHEDEPQDILERAEKAIYSISEYGKTSQLAAMVDFIHDSLDGLEKVFTKQAKVTGLETGFAKLDRLTSGLQPGNMVTLAARPGMGKTSLALDIARHVAVVNGIPAAFYSLEMTRTEIVMRLISALTDIPLYNVRTGWFGASAWVDIAGAAERLSGAPLYLDCSSFDMSAIGIRSSSRRLATRLAREGKKLGLIVIDYLQLIVSHSSKFQSRESEVAEISRSMKALSMDLGVPVLTLSQLNRQTEEMGRAGRPRLSDLRESGSIEQDSDLVLFIYREALYRANASEEEKAKAKLIIAKHRNGAQGEIAFNFKKETTRFYEAEKSEEEG